MLRKKFESFPIKFESFPIIGGFILGGLIVIVGHSILPTIDKGNNSSEREVSYSIGIVDSETYSYRFTFENDTDEHRKVCFECDVYDSGGSTILHGSVNEKCMIVGSESRKEMSGEFSSFLYNTSRAEYYKCDCEVEKFGGRKINDDG